MQAELEEIPQHDMNIVMRDMNAKVGRDNTNYERAVVPLMRMESGWWNSAQFTTSSSEEHSFHTKISTS